MFRVRRMSREDFDFAVKLSNTIDWRMTRQDFEFNIQLEEEGCFILEDDVERLGLATSVSYGKNGWFGNLIVKDEKRGQGGGTTLVKHAADYLKSRGVETIGLYAYPQLQNFYSKFGFKRDIEFLVMKARAVKAVFAEEKLKSITSKDLPLVIDCDRSCFGDYRKKLLELFFKNPANIGYVAVEEAEAVGFAATKIFSESAEIGPLVCIRNRSDLSVKLLKALLNQLVGLEAYMYLPASETPFLEILADAGFQTEFELTRMFVGPFLAKNCIYSAESLERG